MFVLAIHLPHLGKKYDRSGIAAIEEVPQEIQQVYNTTPLRYDIENTRIVEYKIFPSRF